jgi:hypothetical protein
MARKYYGSFYSITGKLHRVEIWDGPTGTTPEIQARLYAARVKAAGGYQEGAGCLLEKLQGLNSSIELTLGGVGYEIEREGEGDTFYENAIRPSRSTSYWVIPLDTILGEFKAIATNTEQYWAVLIYQDDVLQHVGRVLADQMTFLREAIQAKPIISLAAVDGLELLSGYKVQASWFTDGKITVAQLFRRCLDVLALKDYWVVNATNTDYLRDAVAPYSTDAVRKGIDLLQVDLNTFVSDYDQFKDIKATDVDAFQYADNNMLDCKAALAQLCDILQARFLLESGQYWLVSAAEYLDTTVAYRQFTYTLQYIGTGSYLHTVQLGTDARPQWIAKPSLSYQAAAKYVQVDTERMLGTGVYRTYQNKTDALLNKAFTQIPTGTNPDEAPLRIRFAIKFQRFIFTTSPTGPEDESIVAIKIWLTDSSGNKKILDNTNFYWVTGTVVPARYEKIKTDLQSTTWTSFVFDKQVSTAPAGFTTLNVEVTQVAATKTTYNVFGNASGYNSTIKEFWGSIQVAFGDASPYQNPDFTFNVTETYTPDSANAVNSTPIILEPKYYYSSSKYAIGNIEAYNSSNQWVIADDWYGGWDSTSHGSPTEMLGEGVAGLYKDFVPTIQGTWVDAGTLTAIKSLYFDTYKWLFNGAVYSARSEQWAGEWLGLIPVYTGLTSSGEGLKVGTGLKDRVNYHEEQIGRLNDSVQRTPALVLDHLVNEANGGAVEVPTQNTRYEVMVQYNYADEQMVWHLQEHNAPVTYTAGTHTITNGYETILCDSTDGNVTINLPPAPDSKGKKYYFIKVNNGNVVTISGNGYNISGAGSTTIGNHYGSKTIICDGAVWYIIATV